MNGDFGFDEDAESLEQREASVLGFIAGLAMDAWNVNISKGPDRRTDGGSQGHP